jgi:hypothetical protein
MRKPFRKRITKIDLSEPVLAARLEGVRLSLHIDDHREIRHRKLATKNIPLAHLSGHNGAWRFLVNGQARAEPLGDRRLPHPKEDG